MRIIFFGTPSFVVPILETLIQHFTVVSVVTTPDKKAGRKQLLTPTPVKKFSTSDAINIPVFTPHTFDNETIKQLHAMQPDLFVVAAYGHILPEEVLNIPPFGAINVHPSLLPKYRGPTPVPSTLLNGDEITGVTVIKMDKEMDHGPILAMKDYKIHATDTTELLLNHLFNLSAEMLPEVISNYTNGKIEAEAQDESKATYTKKIEKIDGHIDIQNPPDTTTLTRRIHAFYPWPTVWTKWKMKNGHEKIVKFLPGEKLQMEGKNPVTLQEFIRAYPETKEALVKLFKRSI